LITRVVEPGKTQTPSRGPRAAERNTTMLLRHLQRVLSLTAVLLPIAGILPAAAANYCVQDSGTGTVIVGKSYAVPANGQCNTFQGFVARPSDSFNFLTAGNACKSHDGRYLSFNLSYTGPGFGGFSFVIDLLTHMPVPGYECDLTGSPLQNSCALFSGSTVPCPSWAVNWPPTD
jgi:hypothetical protein